MSDPDYTTMSGAEFKRAVGIDPEKWGEAFVQRGLRQYRDVSPPIDPGAVASWFRDYGEAVLAAIGNPYAVREVLSTPERRREIAKDALGQQ